MLTPFRTGRAHPVKVCEKEYNDIREKVYYFKYQKKDGFIRALIRLRLKVKSPLESYAQIVAFTE